MTGRNSGHQDRLRQPVFGDSMTKTNGAGCDRVHRKKLVVAERNIHTVELNRREKSLACHERKGNHVARIVVEKTKVVLRITAIVMDVVEWRMYFCIMVRLESKCEVARLVQSTNAT